jgi:DNA polymerase-3 subunit alpha
MSLPKYLCTDAETGGTATKNSLLTAYFAVMDENKGVIDELQFKLKPKVGTTYNCNPEALRHNGINLQEHDANAIPMEEGTALLIDFLARHSGAFKLIPLGQNVSFDFRFYYEHLLPKAEFLKYCTEDVEDTLKIAQDLRKSGRLALPSLKLGVMCEHFDIQLANAHSEKDDAIATAMLHTRLVALRDGKAGQKKGEAPAPIRPPISKIQCPTTYPFLPLRVITQYSILRGASSIEDYIGWAKANGCGTIGITDFGFATGALELYTKAKENKLAPVPGMIVHVADRSGHYDLTLWATTDKGYRNLLWISSQGFSKTLIDNKVRAENTKHGLIPRVTFEELITHLEGIAVGTGNYEGPLGRMGRVDAESMLQALRDAADVLFVELVPRPYTHAYDGDAGGFVELTGGDLQKKSNQIGLILAEELQLPLMLSQDGFYAKPEARAVQDVLLQNLDPTSGSRVHQPHHCMTTQEAWDAWESMHPGKGAEFTQAILGGHLLANMAADLSIQDSYHLPEIELPEDIRTMEVSDGEKYKTYILRQIEKHGRMNWEDPKWTDRLAMEMNVICDNGSLDFSRYFLFLEYWAQWTRDNSILSGAGRGSGAGSLLCYLLKITHLDPFKFDLPFERFLSEGRIIRGKYPDIDWDMGYRDPLLAKLEETYQDKFAQASTHGRLRIKNAIKNGVRILLDWSGTDERVEAVTKDIENTPTGVDDKDFLLGYTDRDGVEHEAELDKHPALKTFFEEYPQVYEMVLDLLGKPASIGRHASAYLISDRPIHESVPTCMIGSHTCTQYTAPPIGFNAVEKAGLVKFDLLTVNTLLDVANAIRMVQGRHGHKVWKEKLKLNGREYEVWKGDLSPELLPKDGQLLDIYNLPEDASVYYMIGEGDTASLFQVSTPLMTTFTKRIKPTTIFHMSDLVAIIRSGPLEAKIEDGKTTMTEAYVQRKRGEMKITYAHPEMEPILKSTYGVACLPEGSLLDSEIGPVKIEDVRPGVRLLSSNGRSVWSGEVEKIWKTGIKKVISINLSSGTKIVSSEDHRFLTVDGDRRANELKYGSGRSWQDASIVYERWPESSNEIYLKENEAYLLGLLASDGCLTQSTVSITCGSEVAAKWCSELMSDTWGGRPSYYFNTRAFYASSVTTQNRRNISPVPMALDRLYEGRKWKVAGAGKHLPASMLRYSEQDRKDFLCGLWDGDGSYVGAYFFRNKSLILLEQVCDLLGSLKISYISSENTVQVTDTVRFLEQIGGPRIPNKKINDTCREMPLPAKSLLLWSKDLDVGGNDQVKSFKANVVRAAKLGGLTALSLRGHHEWKRVYERIYTETYLLDVRPVIVKSISSMGEANCYDLQMKDQANPYFLCDGVVVHNCYQEQLQRMFSDLAGYSLQEADEIREMIGKKKAQDMQKALPELRRRLAARGWTDTQTQVFVDLCVSSSKYSFNRAHSASYGLLAYQSAYLKKHFHLEWWTAVLQNAKVEDIREKGYSRALKDVLRAPHVNGPTETFEMHGEQVHAPLYLIKQIGDAACAEILGSRKMIEEILIKDHEMSIEEAREAARYSSLQDFFERAHVNKTVFTHLILCGAFDEIEPGRSAGELLREWAVLDRVSGLKSYGDGKFGPELRAAADKYLADVAIGKATPLDVPFSDTDGIEVERKRLDLLSMYRVDALERFRPLLENMLLYSDNCVTYTGTSGRGIRVLHNVAEVEAHYNEHGADRKAAPAAWVGLVRKRDPWDYKDKKTKKTVTAMKIGVAQDGDELECIVWPNILERFRKVEALRESGKTVFQAIQEDPAGNNDLKGLETMTGRETKSDGCRLLLCVGVVKPSREPGKWSMGVNEVYDLETYRGQ